MSFKHQVASISPKDSEKISVDKTLFVKLSTAEQSRLNGFHVLLGGSPKYWSFKGLSYCVSKIAYYKKTKKREREEKLYLSLKNFASNQTKTPVVKNKQSKSGDDQKML